MTHSEGSHKRKLKFVSFSYRRKHTIDFNHSKLLSHIIIQQRFCDISAGLSTATAIGLFVTLYRIFQLVHNQQSVTVGLLWSLVVFTPVDDLPNPNKVAWFLIKDFLRLSS